MRTSDCCFKSLSLGCFLPQHCIVTEVANTVKGCKYLWGFGLICFGLTLPELRKAIWRESGSFSRRDLSGWQGALASWESRRDEGKLCSLSGPSSETANTKGSCPRPSAGETVGGMRSGQWSRKAVIPLQDKIWDGGPETTLWPCIDTGVRPSQSEPFIPFSYSDSFKGGHVTHKARPIQFNF